MAIEIDGKVYRNIQEQVQKNKEDIEELQAKPSGGYTWITEDGTGIINYAADELKITDNTYINLDSELSKAFAVADTINEVDYLRCQGQDITIGTENTTTTYYGNQDFSNTTPVFGQINFDSAGDEYIMSGDITISEVYANTLWPFDGSGNGIDVNTLALFYDCYCNYHTKDITAGDNQIEYGNYILRAPASTASGTTFKLSISYNGLEDIPKAFHNIADNALNSCSIKGTTGDYITLIYNADNCWTTSTNYIMIGLRIAPTVIELYRIDTEI